jgi:hypothetical protein
VTHGSALWNTKQNGAPIICRRTEDAWVVWFADNITLLANSADGLFGLPIMGLNTVKEDIQRISVSKVDNAGIFI